MIKVGIAGIGAIGSSVAKALQDGIGDYVLTGISETKNDVAFDVPNLKFKDLVQASDILIESLPPDCVPELAECAFKAQKDLISISSAAYLIYPELLELHAKSKSRLIIPSGALAGLDGVNALREMGIESANLRTIKPPKAYDGAPHIVRESIALDGITKKQRLFKGNAFEAARAFPANINVAATLSLAGIGPERTQVEIWADPETRNNSHEITVETALSKLTSRIENAPDPANPKTSVLAAQSIIAVLKGFGDPLVVL